VALVIKPEHNPRLMNTKTKITLDRVASRFGVASRTDSRKAIVAGRMKVNGRTVRDPDIWVDPERDSLQLDGQRLKPARKRYLLFYKPKGVLTSHGDPAGRDTIYKYLGDENNWVSPVGRLDKDTSGLLLLTNDTKFADFVTSPESDVPKTYLVKVNALLSDEVIAQLQVGVEMKRGDFAHPVSVVRREDRGKYTWLDIVLTEGKNREVRRMFEAVGFVVLKLVRTQIGPLTLEGLQVGKWRELTNTEVSSLRTIGQRHTQKEKHGAKPNSTGPSSVVMHSNQGQSDS
jgi:23S rRNA pseudouridine2605 synthase